MLEPNPKQALHPTKRQKKCQDPPLATEFVGKLLKSVNALQTRRILVVQIVLTVSGCVNLLRQRLDVHHEPSLHLIPHQKPPCVRSTSDRQYM